LSICLGVATERMDRRVVRNTLVQSSAFRKSSLKARATSLPGAIRRADPDTSDIVSGSRRVPAPTVLHASFDGRRLLLWAETRPKRDYAGLSGHGRRQRGTALPPSPYDAGGTALLAALDHFGVLLADCPVGTVVISLPSLNGAPLASSGLVADPPDSVDKAALQPWTVSAVAMTWSATIELLCVCAGRRTQALGVIVGEDLAYWTAAMRQAAALVARQHFLPDIVEEDGAFAARWRPVPTHSEAQAMAQFEAAMPDACRALGADRASSAPHAATILSGFVERVVDYLARADGSHPARSAHTQFDSLEAQWLDALQRADPGLEGDRAALLAFQQRVRAWWRPLAIGAASPFRLCFRLEEPEIVDAASDDVSYESAAAGDRPWYLRYLLQAHHDQSLLVTASKAWSARGREAQPFARNGFNVREFILQSLGQAARICPPIEDSLRGGIPDAHQLDAAAAARFLTEQAGVLEQAGFGIVLPASWSSKGTKLRLTTRARVRSPSMSVGAGLSLEALVEVDWEAVIGDKSVSPEELRALARLKTPLVKMRGQWVLLNAQEIRDAITRLNRSGGKLTARDALAMALGSPDGDGLRAGPVAVEGWFRDLIERLSERERIAELPPPTGFTGMLRPYQERGYSWLSFLCRWGLGACLADDMGLGKTLQTLVHIQRERQTADAGPVLLICPTSVISNWQHEAARFTPSLRVMVHHGIERARGESFRDAVRGHDIVLTSYALLQRDLETFGQVEWAGVILDEAQNIKNPESKQARAARSIRSDYRIALTGTPVENHVGDLWSLMEFLNPGLLGGRAEFKRRFLVPIQASNSQDAAQRLKSLTGPFILRRLKTDKSVIADLPDKLEMTVYCTLTREQASLYASVVAEAMPGLESSEGIARKGLVLATLSKLKQVCNHPAQFLGDNSTIDGRSGKLTRLAEMLEEVIESGERALIFSQFAEMGDIIRRHLEALFGREVLFLHGSVPKVKRDQMVARFQQAESQGPAAFVLSLKAGGTGLNLTAANHVFHFDRRWNPAVENQATDRAFRIGQGRRVLVHKFLCAGTLEEKIDAIVERKKALAEAVVSSGEAWLTKLTTAELRELFTLRADAVGQ
jgi:SNF2 family DNA or RNA helicase